MPEERGIASLDSRQEMVPVDPSLRDRMHMYLSDTFGHSPEGRRRANMFMKAAEWVPGVEESLLFSDAREEAEQGNYLTSGLLGGAGLLSILPFVPPGSGGGGKKVGRSLEEGLASLKRNIDINMERRRRGEIEWEPPTIPEARRLKPGERGGRWGGRKKDFRPDADALKASAARQGYETDRVLYHGARKPWVHEDPMFRFTRGGDSGPYLTEKPRIANNYSADPGGNTIPVYVKGPGLNLVDAGKRGEPFGPEFRQEAAHQLNISLENMSRADQVDAIMDAARAQGYGYVEMKGVIDVGGQQAQVIPLGGDKVRSIWADFDPGLADDVTNLSHASGGLVTLPQQFDAGGGVFGDDFNYLGSADVAGGGGVGGINNLLGMAQSQDVADAGVTVTDILADSLAAATSTQHGGSSSVIIGPNWSDIGGYLQTDIPSLAGLWDTVAPEPGTMGSEYSIWIMENIINDAVESMSSKTQWTKEQIKAFQHRIRGNLLEAAINNPTDQTLQQVAADIRTSLGNAVPTIASVSNRASTVSPDNTFGDISAMSDDDLLAVYGSALENLNGTRSYRFLHENSPRVRELIRAGVSSVEEANRIIEAEQTNYHFENVAKAQGDWEEIKAAITTRGLEMPTGTFTQNVSRIGSTVGGWMDKIFDFFGIARPDYAVGQPGPGGTLVWGKPQGNKVFSRVGTTPGGTVVGVQTGIPILDRILSKVAGVATGRVEAGEVFNPETVAQMVLDAATDELGLDPGTITVSDIAGAVSKVLEKINEATSTGTTYAVGAATIGTLFENDEDKNKVVDVTTGNVTTAATGADKVIDVGSIDPNAANVVATSEIVDPPAAITLGANLRDIVLGADVSQKEKVGGGQQRIDAGGNINPDVQTGDEISAVNVGGDVLGSDVGGDVFGSDIGGDISGDRIGGGISGDQIGGGISGDQIGGGISGDRLGGALSFAGAGGDYSRIGAGGATGSDRVGGGYTQQDTGGGDYTLGFGGGERSLGYGGDRTDLVVGDRLYDLTTGGAERAVDLDEVTLGGATSSSDKTLTLGGDKTPGGSDTLGWEIPSLTSTGYRGMGAEPGDIMELDSIIDTPYSQHSYSDIVAYLKANARKAEEEANI